MSILFGAILQSYAFYSDAEGKIEWTEKKFDFFCKSIPDALPTP